MEKGRKIQYLISICVSVASVTMGMTSAWSSIVLPEFHHNKTRVDIDDNDAAWMLSMTSPGFIFGTLLAGFTTDKIGRRATMLWSALPYTAGMIIVACARKAWPLFITQFLWSCAIGMLNTSRILYCAEVARKDMRGRLCLITKVTFNIGNLLMMCVGPFISYETLNYILILMPISYLLACWWIPESPYFYLKGGNVNAAREVLRKLHGSDSADFIDLEDELVAMQKHVKCEMRRSSSVKELIVGKCYRKAICIATGLKTIQIFIGVSTVQKYLGLIITQDQLGIKLSTVLIGFGVVNFVTSIMASYLVDRVKKRPLLIYSYMGTGICLAVVGIYFLLMEIIKIDQALLTPYGFVAFAGIICSNIISTMGHKSLTFVISGEIFPLNVKAIATTSLFVFCGVLGFFETRKYQALKNQIGLCGVFWVYAAVALCGSIFSYFCIPEMKGMSLKEIQMLLQGDLYEDKDSDRESNVVANDDDNMNDGADWESNDIDVDHEHKELTVEIHEEKKNSKKLRIDLGENEELEDLNENEILEEEKR